MNKVLETLNGLTAEDLEALRGEIATLDEQLRKLRQAEKFLAGLLGVDTRKRSVSDASGGDEPEDEDDAEDGNPNSYGTPVLPRMLKSLEKGPKTKANLARELRCSPEAINYNVKRCDKLEIDRAGRVAIKGSGDDESDDLADKIFDLLTEEGSMPVPAIAGRLDVSPNSVGLLVREHEWFRRTPNGEIEIAKAGAQ